MAGRPRKAAEQVGELEEQSLLLAGEMFLLAPKMYLEPSGEPTPLREAWNNAVSATLAASVRVEELGELLRKRAGLTGPSPSKQFLCNPQQDDVLEGKCPQPEDTDASGG